MNLSDLVTDITKLPKDEALELIRISQEKRIAPPPKRKTKKKASKKDTKTKK